jgi:hypothetical protein
MHFLANCASNGTLHIEYIYIGCIKKTEQIWNLLSILQNIH